MTAGSPKSSSSPKSNSHEGEQGGGGQSTGPARGADRRGPPAQRRRAAADASTPEAVEEANGSEEAFVCEDGGSEPSCVGDLVQVVSERRSTTALPSGLRGPAPELIEYIVSQAALRSSLAWRRAEGSCSGAPSIRTSSLRPRARRVARPRVRCCSGGVLDDGEVARAE